MTRPIARHRACPDTATRPESSGADPVCGRHTVRGFASVHGHAVMERSHRLLSDRAAADPRPDHAYPARLPTVRVIRDVEHIPRRPSWDCTNCGKPWPCDTARTEIAGGGDSISRIIYLEIQFSQAQADMPHAPIGELYQRLIAWLGRQPPV